MKLNIKFTLLLITLMVFIEVVVFNSVKRFAEEVVAEVLVKYGEAISIYDQEKSFATILHDARLMKRFTSEPVLRQWLLTPDEQSLFLQVLPLLESYQWWFEGANYYVVSLTNFAYYGNNRTNEFDNGLKQYTLSRDAQQDRWFFHFLDSNKPFQISSTYDSNLNIERLWIDHKLYDDDGNVIGVAGTNLPFSRGLEPLLEGKHQGIDTIFVDDDEIIQVFRKRDPYFGDQIETGQYQLLPIQDYIADDAENAKLAQGFIQAKESGVTYSTVISREETRYLYVIDHIEEINWYELTVMDLEMIFPSSKFTTLYVVLGGMIVFLVVLVNVFFLRWVSTPVKELQDKTWQITQPHADLSQIRFSRKPNDELGELMMNFEAMAKTIKNSHDHLEAKVKERTEALDRLASIDALTALLNRRGMERQLKTEYNYLQRDGHRLALMCLDVDKFKSINDSMGHDKGDEALIIVANCVRAMIRDYDSASRWGGDEFMLLVRLDDHANLFDVAERLRVGIGKQLVETEDKSKQRVLSVSIGAVEVERDQPLKDALNHADIALYNAKNAGRNCVRLWTSETTERSHRNIG